MKDNQNKSSSHQDESIDVPKQPVKRKSFLKRSWTFIRRLTLVCLILGAITVAWMLQLARTEPAAFKQYDEFKKTNSPTQIKEMATEAKAKLQSIVANLDAAASATATNAEFDAEGNPIAKEWTGDQLKQQLKDESEIYDKVHTIFMTDDELNAVLITSLEEWIQERGYKMPEEVSDPMISLDGSQIVIGFRVNVSGYSQSLTAPVNLKFLDNGKVRVMIESYHAGELPIPASSLGVWLGKKAPNNSRMAEAAQWLDKLDGIEIKPVIKLATRHRAWVTSMKHIDDGVELKIKMQPPKKY